MNLYEYDDKYGYIIRTIKREPYGTIERIAERMKILNINQSKLSEKSGISKNTISTWFNKKELIIRKSNLKLIADALECDLEFLTCEQDNPRKERSKKIKLKTTSLTDKYLSKIADLMKETNIKIDFTYTWNIDTEERSQEIKEQCFVHDKIKYYCECIETQDIYEFYYLIRLNGGKPIKKTEEEMGEFVKNIVKYISFEISQL